MDVLDHRIFGHLFLLPLRTVLNRLALARAANPEMCPIPLYLASFASGSRSTRSFPLILFHTFSFLMSTLQEIEGSLCSISSPWPVLSFAVKSPALAGVWYFTCRLLTLYSTPTHPHHAPSLQLAPSIGSTHLISLSLLNISCPLSQASLVQLIAFILSYSAYLV